MSSTKRRPSRCGNVPTCLGFAALTTFTEMTSAHARLHVDDAVRVLGRRQHNLLRGGETRDTLPVHSMEMPSPVRISTHALLRSPAGRAMIQLGEAKLCLAIEFVPSGPPVPLQAALLPPSGGGSTTTATPATAPLPQDRLLTSAMPQIAPDSDSGGTAAPAAGSFVSLTLEESLEAEMNLFSSLEFGGGGWPA